ncbi:winged helix-turn-helix transcriptional regulator [Flavihumibacter petaseus]|uniref:Putative HxlR family transcriptional regulator n=1 Tax=Flavihumibacter petaseus NBRC 106054 TaxID=1220578 RepID=A0A0E9N6X2_9BACT|nr:helix-turn-helix domain-containing protein [Flavihumibacter petaseus]GAO45441.1 putative HxlR family transcriptional regulator [Flavihumibacter petaseus NBRC 106054]
MAPATKAKTEIHTAESCIASVRAVKDALEVLSGRWKLPIILSVSFGTKRFKQISKELNGITDKVLSKELKELEANQLISRTVYDAFPPVVEYAITDHGKSLNKVIAELGTWGAAHRKKIIGR